jgi:hypothetical protein
VRRSLLLTILIAAFACFAIVGAKAQSVIPTQFIAKLYTEALGRAPDQQGWAGHVSFFQPRGCSAGTLAQVGEAVYSSSEFAADAPDAQSKVMALYRGALNRDPDATGLAHYSRQLENGTPLASVVNTIFTSPEFLADAVAYCGANPDYGVPPYPVALPTPTGSGYAGTEAGLQAELNCAGKGDCPSTVHVAQKAVINLTSPLQIPQNVTLATMGNPGPHNYTQMGRLVRVTSFLGPMVQVDAGGSLLNMWVDGRRNALGYKSGAENIETLGGSGTTVSYNKIVEPQGGSNLEANGAQSGSPCGHENVIGNLLTGYSTIHGYTEPADGMTMQCENLDIEDNEIVDMTDIGILLEGSVKVTQNSQILHNTIVSAGNSMNAAISTDPTTGNAIPTQGQFVCFGGASFEENTFWTGPYTTFDFGVEAGAREFFQTTDPRQVDGTCADGSGPIYKNNTTGTLSARVRAGIAVAGMLNVTIANDGSHPLNVRSVAFPALTPGAACPGASVIAEEAGGHASGSYPVPEVDQMFDFCTVHN